MGEGWTDAPTECRDATASITGTNAHWRGWTLPHSAGTPVLDIGTGRINRRRDFSISQSRRTCHVSFLLPSDKDLPLTCSIPHASRYIVMEPQLKPKSTRSWQWRQMINCRQ